MARNLKAYIDEDNIVTFIAVTGFSSAWLTMDELRYIGGVETMKANPSIVYNPIQPKEDG